MRTRDYELRRLRTRKAKVHKLKARLAEAKSAAERKVLIDKILKHQPDFKAE